MTGPALSVSPSVGVLLATYNGAAHCEEQIISLLWQRGVRVHVYVRDDGSQDDTMAIVKRLAEANSGRITVIDNRGVQTGSACSNFFAMLREVDRNAHAFYAFADQDDVWLPDKLHRAVEVMRAVAADAYSSDLIAYHEDRNTAWVLHKAGNDAPFDYLFQGASAGCTYVLTAATAHLVAEVMATVPPLCPGASHDWITYAICRSRGLTWVRDRQAAIVYRQHASNQYGARQGWSDVVAKFRLTRSGWYRRQILWLRNVVVGSADEMRALDAVERGDLSSRWWLIRHASRFRRTKQSVRHLRAAVALRSV